MLVALGVEALEGMPTLTLSSFDHPGEGANDSGWNGHLELM